MATVETLLTAEEYLKMPDNGVPSELVRGRVVEMNVPAPRHGQICAKVVRLIGNFVEDQDMGQVVSNDSGVVTEKDPDSVRGADVAYYSHKDVPHGPLPRGYLPVLPRMVFEVLSPNDRWNNVLTKVAEYLTAGVKVVCVLDEFEARAYLYFADRAETILEAEQELSVPDVLGDFCVRVEKFFE